MSGHPTAAKVQERLHALGLDVEVKVLAGSTRTAVEAADACGCELGQIVKTLVFVEEATGDPVVCLWAGDRQLPADELGLRRATADEVREATGFAVGGVPPVGHDRPPIVFIDRDLEALGTLWAAAGTPNAVFALSWNDLRALTNGRVGDVALTELVAPTPGPRPQADDRRN
jgi:prolyl-tRNA editing enzyme YbaK/EbsC (Cys-tRNA(Pro) deacylase)